MKSVSFRFFVLAMLLIFTVMAVACAEELEGGVETDTVAVTQGDAVTDVNTQADVVTDVATEAISDDAVDTAAETAAEEVTEVVTEVVTEEVTEEATEVVTEEVTEVVEEATEEMTEVATEEATEVVTEPVTEPETRRDLTWETYDPALDNSSVDTSATHTVDPTQWVGVDGLDRVLPTNTQTGDTRDKTVAMFYWTWHGELAGQQSAFNNQQNLDLLFEYGLEEEDYFRIPAAQLASEYGIYTADATAAKYHFWDEPVFGYYDGDDEWVIRKHAEMLAAAGVDVVFFDNTNGEFTWMETAKKVMKVFSEARAQGVDAPDVSFMLPFGPVKHSGNQMIQLYTEIYEKGLYQDVWYMLDGKPMLMAWPNSFDTEKYETHAQYAPIIKSFFTFRSNIGAYDDNTTAANFWGWLSVFPQQFYYNGRGELEQITVGVAVNHNYVEGKLAPMSGDNIISRTWTSKGYDTRENAMLYGACFAEQWENAIGIDPNIVFVTGWNEWIAMKLDSWNGYENCFVDQYNDEYSRDCEPSNGPMKDHYYYQLISYIRQYKGTNPIEVASPEKLMDVNGGYGQWADVGPTYTDYFGLTNRNHTGYLNPETKQSLIYINETGRNDIYDAKVARDYETIYFMVRTVEDITPYTDEDWMRLYISTGDSSKNWEGYEYVLNKTTPTATQATLEKFTGRDYETRVVGTVSYTVQGNVMMVAIPKTMLGISATTDEFTFDFKWVDNANEDQAGDIMLWYSNGDVAPIGRFNYCYTTSAFAENQKRPTYGWVDLDLTDETSQAQVESGLVAENGSLISSKIDGMTYAFGEAGMTITSTKAANELTLDYAKSPAYVTADKYKYVAVTYVCNDPNVTTLRVGFGSGDGAPSATYSRAKTLDIIADGQTHTAYIDLSKNRAWVGCVKEIGFFFDKTKSAGLSITISAVELLEENPVPDEVA